MSTVLSIRQTLFYGRNCTARKLNKELQLQGRPIHLATTMAIFMFMEEKIWNTSNLMIFGALTLLLKSGDKFIRKGTQEEADILLLLLDLKILFSEEFWRLRKN